MSVRTALYSSLLALCLGSASVAQPIPETGGPDVPSEAWCADQMGMAINVKTTYETPDATEYLEVGGPLWVRSLVTVGQHGKITNLYNSYHGNVKILALLNQESFNLTTPPDTASAAVWSQFADDFADKVVTFATFYGSKVAAFEIWNEPDHTDYFSAQKIAEVINKSALALHNEGFTGHQVIAGGLAGGWEDYIQELAPLVNKTYVDGFGFHPYAKSAGGIPIAPGVTPLKDAVEKFWNYTGGHPVWLTEFGHAVHPETGDFEEQAQYLRFAFEDIKALGPQKVPHAFWFAWDDRTAWEVQTHAFGLVDRHDQSLRPNGFAFADITLTQEDSSLPCSTWDDNYNACVQHDSGDEQQCTMYPSCSKKCVPVGTSECQAGCSSYCDGSPASAPCSDWDGYESACNAASSGTQSCAYYACSGKCRPSGTSRCQAGCSQYCCNSAAGGGGGTGGGMDGTYQVSLQASGSGAPGSGACTANFNIQVQNLQIPTVLFQCVGSVVVEAYMTGDLTAQPTGLIGGSVGPYYDSTNWTGQINVARQISGSFTGLSLGVEYSGTFTATPVDCDAQGNCTPSVAAAPTFSLALSEDECLGGAYAGEGAAGGVACGPGAAAAVASPTPTKAAISAPAKALAFGGTALYFDGVDDAVELINRPEFNFTDALTLTAWIRPDNIWGPHAVVNKWYAMDSYLLNVVDGRIDFSVSFPNGSWGESKGVSGTAVEGQWTHVAGVYDGASVRLYLNGIEVDREPASGILQQSDRPLVIGNHLGAFEGAIGDVRLFERVLTPEEIHDVAGLDPDQTGRVVGFQCSTQYQSGWCERVMDGVHGTCNWGEWATQSQASGWVRLDLDLPTEITSVELWDRACGEQVMAGHLEFSDGSTVAFSALENSGQSSTVVSFTPRQTTYVKVVIDQSAHGANPGIAEIVINDGLVVD